MFYLLVEGEEEYKVESILDSKRTGDQWEYLVKWKGYGPEEDSWEPKENLDHAKELLKKYHRKLMKKARDAAKDLKGGTVS